MSQESAQSHEAPPKFSSPEEELKWLRERVAQQEAILHTDGKSEKKESVVSREVIQYGKEEREARLEEHVIMENPQFERALEHLSSIPHREKVRELYRILAEKGILNAIKLAQSLGNPHIEDDFHGVLVDYVKSGASVPGLDRERDLSKKLKMTLFEVSLPFQGGEGDKRPFKEVIVSMERFLLGMIPGEEMPHASYGPFTLELALSNFTNDIVFYIGVEEHMKDMFVQQLLGAFPTAKVEIDSDDYNIFNEFGVASGSYATSNNNFVFPINLAEDIEHDPLKIILNAFTRVARDGEGAAIQIVVYPDEYNIKSKLKHAVGQIKQGVPLERATHIPLSTGGEVTKSLKEFFHTQISSHKPSEREKSKELEFRDQAIEMIEKKISSMVASVNVRVITSAATRERADSIRSSIESAFNQFNSPQGNGLKFIPVIGKKLPSFLHHYTFREHDNDEALPLNTREIATFYHPPESVSQKEAPQLKSVKSNTAPAPADLPTEGITLGVNKHRGETREIRVTKPDRLRHFYVIGQTGTGKTKLLKNMIIQDIKNGDGVCFIDPHGTDVEAILANIPKERIDDVIYFDPSYTARPYGLNMLEYDYEKPEQKIFVVNELLSIFRKLYEAVPESMGPAFEQYFRNATMLVMEDPETGNTLLEIPRVMADAAYRNLKLSRCRNPIVVQFWRDIASKTSGESGLANMIPYITNKFDVFLSNDVMRPIIAQEKSSFNFRQLMDDRKILIVNLAKGRLGEINSHLIGLVLVGKIFMAAMSRVDSVGKKLPEFFLYIDEFQNVTTDSISAILSEARKYGLSLTIAHQFIGQLDEGIKNAVFGNVGNMVIHRVGAEDAEFLKPQFAPIFGADDIIKLDNHNAYAKLLMNGKPTSPFNLETSFHPEGHPEIVEQLKQLSYLKFGKDRKIVDDAIMRKYLAASQKPATTTQPAASVAVPIPAAPLAPAPAVTPLSATTPVPAASIQTPVQAVTQTQSPVLQTPPQPVSAQATLTPVEVPAVPLPPSQSVQVVASQPAHLPVQPPPVSAQVVETITPTPVPPPPPTQKPPEPLPISIVPTLVSAALVDAQSSAATPNVPAPAIDISIPSPSSAQVVAPLPFVPPKPSEPVVVTPVIPPSEPMKPVALATEEKPMPAITQPLPPPPPQIAPAIAPIATAIPESVNENGVQHMPALPLIKTRVEKGPKEDTSSLGIVPRSHVSFEPSTPSGIATAASMANPPPAAGSVVSPLKRLNVMPSLSELEKKEAYERERAEERKSLAPEAPKHAPAIPAKPAPLASESLSQTTELLRDPFGSLNALRAGSAAVQAAPAPLPPTPAAPVASVGKQEKKADPYRESID